MSGFTTTGLRRLEQAESGGNPTARNPRSTAVGAFQFTAPTWLEFARANPNLFAGLTTDQILAQRNNPQTSAIAAQWYANRNAEALRRANIPVTDATLALAHNFGPGGARAIWAADPTAPAAVVLGERVIRANPNLRTSTVGDIRDRFAARYNEPLLVAQVPAPPPSSIPPELEPTPQPSRPQEARMDFLNFLSPSVIAQFLAGGASPQVQPPVGIVDPAGGGDEQGLATRYGYAMQSAKPDNRRREFISQALLGAAGRMMQPPPMPAPAYQVSYPSGGGGRIGGPPVGGLLDALSALNRPQRFGGF